MRVAWVLVAGDLQKLETGLYSPLASYRYRAIIPARELRSRGHEVYALGVAENEQAFEFAAQEIRGADAVIFGKNHVAPAVTQRLIDLCRERGIKTIVDFCDDYFDSDLDSGETKLGAYYRSIAQKADIVVASTSPLAARVSTTVGRKAVVISDPFEGPAGEPRMTPNLQRLQQVWFGHEANLPSLYRHLDALNVAGEDYPVELAVVTGNVPGIREEFDRFNAQHEKTLRVRFIAWSLSAMWQTLAECDFVVIPVDKERPENISKSPNRMVEALHAGRFVVAHSIPAYEEFKEWAWVEESLTEGTSWAVRHPTEAVRRLQDAQRYIEAAYSPKAIANAWERIIGAVDSPTIPVVSGPQIGRTHVKKLNLGCGDKILPGYVNVDVVESRRGFKPDVICDLHKLTPFGDNSVDGILSVHVVEHFWRWEVLEILQEWVRVLKPGGQMILECPNLLAAANEFLQNPEAGAGPGPEGQRTMWVFYGDPAWKDPYMIHRWGYTPRSLAQVMHEAGLVNLRQEPAQFKLREPRDMRIVGEKPLN